MKIYQPKHMYDENEKKHRSDEEITIPEIYPNKRTPDSNIPITSDSNVKYAKDWVEFNKL